MKTKTIFPKALQGHKNITMEREPIVKEKPQKKPCKGLKNIIMGPKPIAYGLCLIAASILSINGYSQNVGISPTGVVPDNSAGLDVNFTNKGLLIPRVALTSATDALTIPSPATSLLVYNTGTGSLQPAGFYYWNGSRWVKFGETPAVIYHKVIDPAYLNANATLYETPTLGPNNSYIDFTGGTPANGRILRLNILPAGIYSSNFEYIIEIKVVRESILADASIYDSDEIYGITDGIRGVGFYMPDCNSNSSCCKFYRVVSYTPGVTVSSTVINGTNNITPCQDEASVIIKLNNTSTFIGYLPDALRYEASGSTSNALNISNGLFLEIYRNDSDENYRFRVFEIKITIIQ